MSDSSFEDGWIVGGDVDRVHIGVRISADDLEPDEITALLGVRPTFAARKGAPRPSGAVQRTGIWLVDLPESTEWTLEDGVRALLTRLPSDQVLWDQLANRARLDVFCGLHLEDWNRGVELLPATLGELARRHLTLSLDIYFVGDDDETDA